MLQNQNSRFQDNRIITSSHILTMYLTTSHKHSVATLSQFHSTHQCCSLHILANCDIDKVYVSLSSYVNFSLKIFMHSIMTIHFPISWMISQRQVVHWSYFASFFKVQWTPPCFLQSHSLNVMIVLHGSELKLALSGGACSQI